jgi:alkanesulfonate monooxygenase
MKAVHERAAHHGRLLDYGLRVHMIVRDTEQEAREYADELVSMLDDEEGRKIRERALDAKTFGVAIQAKNREQADGSGFIEPGMWTGVGRARSGCGAALVGSVDQVMGKIERYQKMGIRAFIFSGYPHLDECEIFGSKVLPQLETCSLPQAYGRIPAQTPATPLGNGIRR